MLATALTTMTALEVVLFGENNVALFAVVKVPRFQIAPHVANLPRMKPMPDYTTERVTWSAAEAAGVNVIVASYGYGGVSTARPDLPSINAITDLPELLALKRD